MSAGALIMELIYCIIAFGGFANLFDHKILRATVELISLLAVSFFGVKYLMTNTVAVQGKRAKVVEQRLHPHTAFWTGFVRVLVNPNVLLFWIMIAAVLLANGTLQPAWQSRMACAGGAGLGIGAWFTLLCIGSAAFAAVSRTRHRKLFPSLRHPVAAATRRDRRRLIGRSLKATNPLGQALGQRSTGSLL